MLHSEIHDAATDTHKHCASCGEFKSLSEFTNQTRGFKGKYPSCMKCNRPKQAAWAYGNLPRAVKQRRTKAVRTYGSEALVILERIEAGECCEVCGRRTTKMPIDHDHVTGVVRGLLCSNCNTALGLVGDSEEVLLALVVYLRSHRLKVVVAT